MNMDDNWFDLLDKCDNLQDESKTTSEEDVKELFDKITIGPRKCRKCGSDKLFDDVEEGSLVCLSCGLKLEDLVDNSPEWRFYGSSDSKQSDPTRCGNIINPLLPKSSMGTIISGSANNPLAKWHRWNSMPYKERSLWIVFTIIQNNCIRGGLSTRISDVAKKLYKEVSESIISRGKVRRSLIACSVYFACKKLNVTRSDREISSLFKLDIKDMSKGQKKFIKIVPENFGPSKPADFIPRFCSKLHIDDEHIEIIKEVVNILIEKRILIGNIPPSIVAGSIYFVSENMKLGINKKNVSTNCHISEVTITKMYKKLEENKQHFLHLLK
jgi:transcription initiation factor TFIIB